MISPSLLLKPDRIVDPIGWAGHIPFAFWIIEAVKPSVFVELGTHSGNSYFAFCQSVASNRLPTRCYAVDTWQGDEHAGFYDNTIFEEVLSHNEERYSGFSSLLRMTFDQALVHFSDGSIDLLHIDGLHTYEAVKHDFEAWLPKLSPRGIVLFHDVNVRERDFGVWQFWEEIAARYPHLAFDHSHGLGVLVVGSEQNPAIGTIITDFQSASGEHLIKALVSRLGHMIKLEHHNSKLLGAASERDAYIETLSRAMAEYDVRIKERDARIGSLLQTVAERDAKFERNITDREAQIANLNTMLHDQRHQAAELEHQLDKLLHSSSWRMTKPVRKLTHSVRKRARKVRKLFFKLFGIIESKDAQAPLSGNASAPGQPQPPPQPPEAARPLDIDFSVAVPFHFAETPNMEGKKVAAIIHLYYENLASEFQSYLSNVPVDIDLFISTTDDFKAAAIKSVFAGWKKGSVEVRLVPNKGRDIAPKLVSFSDVYNQYDYVLHIHGKRSTHADVLSHWRHFLLESLLGTPQVVTSILYAFEQLPNIGMIAAQHFEPMRHWLNWGGNFPNARKLAEKMGFTLEESDPLDFPSGSMFWARTLALKPLLALELQIEDFDSESGQTDATLAHSLERLFFYTCEHAGFSWIKIARPELYEATPKILEVSGVKDLSTIVKRSIFHLLDPCGVKPRSVMPTPLSNAAPRLFNHIRNRALGTHITVHPDTRVAIGLVTYNNSKEELDGSIAAAEISIKSAGLTTAGSLFLIDNGMSTKNMIPESGFITRVDNQGNQGFGGGHNMLMRAAFEAGYEIYIAINPDGLLHNDAVQALVQTVQAAHGKALVEALQFPLEHPKPYDTETLDTPWVSGACIAISKEAYLDLGGFDEEFFMYCEDVDLSWRARAHGYALKTCPRALFLHAVTNRKETPETLQMIFESGITLARKWGSLEFENWLKEELNGRGKPIPSKVPASVPEEWRHIADFSNQMSFAQPRW